MNVLSQFYMHTLSSILLMLMSILCYAFSLAWALEGI